jgi:hypothetical protein
MPYYTFRNKKTGEERVELMTISEAETFSKKHKDWEWMCGAPMIGDPFRLGRIKSDQGFKDRLRDIKKTHKGSTIDPDAV